MFKGSSIRKARGSIYIRNYANLRQICNLHVLTFAQLFAFDIQRETISKSFKEGKKEGKTGCCFSFAK